MENFFTKKFCDRCHASLKNGRIMSMYNEQTICLECKAKENQRNEYRQALEADHAEIRKGNYNFKGIGYKE
jgi:ribosomal protein L40E